jgi:hypothetical protein
MSKISAPPMLQRESMPDAPDDEWFASLLDYSNGFNDQVARALKQGITRLDNTPYPTQAYTLKHGVETEIQSPLPKGMVVKGVFVMQCEGVEVDATTLKPTGKIYPLGLGGPLQWRPSGKPSGSIYVTANYGGNSGQVVNGTLARGSANALATNTAEAIVSIDLTAGEWLVSCLCGFTGTPTGSVIAAAINTTPDFTGANQGDSRAQSPTMPTAGTDIHLVVPDYPVALTADDTWHMVALSTFSSGAIAAYGRITAVRTKIDPSTFGRLNLLFYGE